MRATIWNAFHQHWSQYLLTQGLYKGGDMILFSFKKLIFREKWLHPYYGIREARKSKTQSQPVCECNFWVWDDHVTTSSLRGKKDEEAMMHSLFHFSLKSTCFLRLCQIVELELQPPSGMVHLPWRTQSSRNYTWGYPKKIYISRYTVFFGGVFHLRSTENVTTCNTSSRRRLYRDWDRCQGRRCDCRIHSLSS